MRRSLQLLGRSLRPALLGLALLGALAGTSGAAAPGPPPASIGTTFHRTVPPAVARLPLTDQHGSTVTLDSWPTKTVVLVPFLTLCSEICPFTTGNLFQAERSLAAHHAAGKVEIVELSVDPDRDTPARLAAYAQLTGATWELVTESPSALRTIAHFFGIYYQRTPEGVPPSIDWWTGQPLTYDVAHSDGYYLLQRGSERFATGATPSFHGRLNPKIERFLSPEGRRDMRHPAAISWTPSDLLRALGWALGQPLPEART